MTQAPASVPEDPSGPSDEDPAARPAGPWPAAVRAAGLAVLLAGLSAGAPAPAQDAGSGARLLTLSVSSGLTANTNRGLDEDDEESVVAATTRLSFGYVDETALQSLQISGSTGLRYAIGSQDDDDGNGLSDPSFRFSYARGVPDASFSLNGRLRVSDTNSTIDLTDLLDDPDNPVIVDPDDLTDTLDEATRLTYNLNASYAWRRTAPIGFRVSAGVGGTRFSDRAPGSTLEESDRYRLGLGVDLRLDARTQAGLDLGYATFREEGEDRREDVSFGASLSRSLPRGRIGLRTSVTDSDDGTRTSLLATFARGNRIGWDLSGRVGVTRDTDGDLQLVGGLQTSREAGSSRFNLALNQSVGSSSDDGDVLVTALSASYGTRLTDLLSVSADAAFVRTDEDGEDATSAATLGLSLQRDLTEDWALSAGLTQRFRDNEDGRANDTALSLSLRRSFAFVP